MSQEERHSFVSVLVSVQELPNYSKILQKLVNDITEEPSSLDQFVKTWFSELSNQEATQERLMSLLCSIALAQDPSISMWKRIRAIKNRSSFIEHSLSDAILTYTDLNPNKKPSFISLAREILTALDDSTLESEFDSTNREREAYLIHWNECKLKLDEIWWGVRGGRGLFNYREEFPLFKVIDELDRNELVNILANSRKPYFVSSVLFANGISELSSNLPLLEKYLLDAPNTFNANGEWSGSTLLPLLLSESHQALINLALSPPVSMSHRSETDEMAKENLITSIQTIVNALSSRSDAAGLFARWIPWLIRQILRYKPEDLDRQSSPGFVSHNLLEKIGQKTKSFSYLITSPIDASPWEPWCYQAALAVWAHSGYIPPPQISHFIEKWKISVDDWAESKDKELLNLASMFIHTEVNLPGLGAHLLAYPISKSEMPARTWIDLWESTYILREIIEFTGFDIEKNSSYFKHEVSDLLFLLFRIGLAVLDQQAESAGNINSDSRQAQVELYKALSSAVREMREIDSTIRQEKWQAAFVHLAIRRLIWTDLSSEQNKKNRFEFKDSDAPTFCDYLIETKNDVFELISLLSSAIMQNPPKIDRLKQALSLASINLSETITIAKRLNQYYSNKYPIDEKQIEELNQLLEVVPG